MKALMIAFVAITVAPAPAPPRPVSPMDAPHCRCMASGIAAETQLNSGFVAKGIWGIASDPHAIRDIANKTSPP